MQFGLKRLFVLITIVVLCFAAGPELYRHWCRGQMRAKTKGFAVADGFCVYLDGHMGNPNIKTILYAGNTRTFAEVKPLVDAPPRPIRYAHDGRRVFMSSGYTAFELPDVDAATFEILTPDGAYTRDSKRVYYKGIEVLNANPATFEILEFPFAKDDKEAFIGPRPIGVADLESWKPFAKGSHVGLWGGSRGEHRPLDEEKMGLKGWSGDSEHVYYGLRMQRKADPETFLVLGAGYAKDSETVFYQDSIVTAADASTFVVHDGVTLIHQGLRLGVDSHDQFNEYCAGDVKGVREKTTD